MLINRLIGWAILCALAVGGVTSAQTNGIDTSDFRTVIWRERPIALSMVPGKEKILAFAEDVQWTTPKDLVGIVTGEAAAGKVFLTTTSPFTNVRFRFYGIDSNRYYLFDITASERGEAEPINVVVDSRNATPASSASANASASAVESGEPVSVVDLTRYAFQQVYAPERLLEGRQGITEVRLKSQEWIRTLVPGASVDVKPIAQWRSSDGLYAVALLIQNTGRDLIELDPRSIRSDRRWETLSLMDGVLSPANAVGDSTTAVIVSSAEWSEVSRWLR